MFPSNFTMPPSTNIPPHFSFFAVTNIEKKAISNFIIICKTVWLDKNYFVQ